MPVIEYPASLPVPQTSSVTSAERRQLSDQARPREASALQRDRLEYERLTFPPFDAVQAAAFRAWWKGTLYDGAAFFSAAWPLPRGMVDAVRRFVGAPQWAFIAGGFWRVSAVCEVRGAGAIPVGVPPRPVILLRFNDDVACVTGRDFTAGDTTSQAPNFTDADGLFDRQALFQGTALVEATAHRSYADDDEFFPAGWAGSFQIEFFVEPSNTTLNHTVLWMGRIKAAPGPVQDEVLTCTMAPSAGATVLDVAFNLNKLTGPGTSSVQRIDPLVVLSSCLIDQDVRTHVRLTYDHAAQQARQYHNGVLVAAEDNFEMAGLSTGTETRVILGAAPAGTDGGGNILYAAPLGAKLDEFRFLQIVDTDGEFITPQFPHRVPYDLED